jgi:hypothetical protein
LPGILGIERVEHRHQLLYGGIGVRYLAQAGSQEPDPWRES